MARTEVSYSDLVSNGSLTDPSGTSLNAGSGNGHFIDAAEPELTVLRVTNTDGSAHDITVVAGDYPPALAAGQGNLAVTVAATTGVEWIGPFESGRFLQNDGQLLVNVEASHAGTITAFRVPRDT